MSITVMRQALEALESAVDQLAKPYSTQVQYAITSIRQAIADAEKQEPVASAWMHKGEMVNAFPWPPNDPRGCDEDKYWKGKGYTAEPLYTHPQPAQPKREWVGLTDEDKNVSNFAYSGASVDYMDGYECGMEAAEAKLKEKNTK
jgi:hypothetical protein